SLDTHLRPIDLFPTRRSSDLRFAARVTVESILFPVKLTKRLLTVISEEMVNPPEPYSSKVPPVSGSAKASALPIGKLSAAHFIRSEEHTSELQLREDLVCRLL